MEEHEFWFVRIQIMGRKYKVKMSYPNRNGTIYYGTDYQYIYDLDKFGLKSPRHRDEQFISVSISGYKSKIKCEHPELKEFASVYAEEIKIAKFSNGYLSYKNGYTNSLTCIEGFGPSPNLYIIIVCLV